VVLILLHAIALPQNKISLQFAQQLTNIEKDLILSNQEKLQKVITLKKEFEKSDTTEDSVYAKILHRIGALQDKMNQTNESIQSTLNSIFINTSGRKDCSRKMAINSYFNLGVFYQKLHFYNLALDSYEKCVIIGNEYKDSTTIDRITKARIKKGNIYYQIGDYQKNIDEISIGLETFSIIKNTANAVDLLNERAQAYTAMKRTNEALVDVQKSIELTKKNDYEAYAKNYKIRAEICKANNNFVAAMNYYKKVIICRTQANNINDLASDYNDVGTVLGRLRLFNEAKSCLNQSLTLAVKIGDHVTAAIASNNLGWISLITNDYPSSLQKYHTSLIQFVPTFKGDNALDNPSYLQCGVISDKNFLSLLLANKAECLLYLYKQTSDKQYLTSALQTAKLTDSIITDMRHEQTGEQSKLYWRDETREFFANAIEASYQAKDANKGFFLYGKKQGCFAE
jgi:tetratricopeptide (TPR) repeat protein